MGVLIDGAMQHAAQAGRQFMGAERRDGTGRGQSAQILGRAWAGGWLAVPGDCFTWNGGVWWQVQVQLARVWHRQGDAAWGGADSRRAGCSVSQQIIASKIGFRRILDKRTQL
jgi:hypothetical protein